MTTTTRKAAYRIQHDNGKFCHVRGKAEAYALACTQAGAPQDTDAKTLKSEWGVTVERISAKQAEAVGI
jgi:hypothetical protein